MCSREEVRGDHSHRCRIPFLWFLEISLFYTQVKSLLSHRPSSPGVALSRVSFPATLSVALSSPLPCLLFPSLHQVLNRKVVLGDNTGDTNVMGATQANTKGVGTFSWHHSRGSHFSPQGQLDPERDSLYPSGGQHTTTSATQPAIASDTK